MIPEEKDAARFLVTNAIKSLNFGETEVMAEIAAMGFRNMTIAPSSLYSIHEPLIDHIKNSVVTCIEEGKRELGRG